MDVLPFICRNGLWHLDKPEFLNLEIIGYAPLILVEKGFVEILDKLSTGVFTSLQLEFHYKPIHPYDTLLIKEGVRYRCVSVLGRDWDSFVWFPKYVFMAMEANHNPDRIYIKIRTVLV